MDGSSLGRDYEMFTLILRNIERALKDVVDGKRTGGLYQRNFLSLSNSATKN